MIDSSQAYQAAVIGAARRVYLRAVVDISDPDMTLGELTVSSKAPWAKAEALTDRDFSDPAPYATLELNRWILDGQNRFFPEDFQIPEKEFAGGALCGGDGVFQDPVVISQTFSGVSILQAFSVYFSTRPEDGVPEELTAEVLYNGTPYFTQQVAGNRDTSISFTGFTVYNPTEVRLTITKWSLPYHRVRLTEFIVGVYEVWDGRMFASFEVTHQGDFSCLKLPYGTASLSIDNRSRRFEPRSKDGVFQSLDERQGIEVHLGVLLQDGAIEYKPLGIFYQYGDGWKTGDNGMTMQWSLVDIVGLLADRTFLPPDALPTTLGGWISALAAQLGVNFAARYHVDPEYAGLAVTAAGRDAVTGKKCGDILRWACMATGTWPRADAQTGYLSVEPLWNQGNKLLLRAMASYPTMKANESLAALIFHLSNGEEYVVSGNATSSEKMVTVENPFLHTRQQALTAARQILSTYGGNLFETTGRGDPSSEIGDVDVVWLDEGQATTGRRMYQTFNLSEGVLENCASRLLQADGSFLYSERAIITEDCDWIAPAEDLRIILVQGGDGSCRGTDGHSNSLLSSGENGQKGADGQGGKVFAATVKANPQQVFPCHIGRGGRAEGGEGEETTFGPYSSAAGERFPLGFSDIVNGDSYGRTGVRSPQANTGDGAEGGAGGSAGVVEYECIPAPPGSMGMWSDIIAHVISPPTPGEPGKPGASGVIIVYWDKPEV